MAEITRFKGYDKFLDMMVNHIKKNSPFKSSTKEVMRITGIGNSPYAVNLIRGLKSHPNIRVEEVKRNVTNLYYIGEQLTTSDIPTEQVVNPTSKEIEIKAYPYLSKKEFKTAHEALSTEHLAPPVIHTLILILNALQSFNSCKRVNNHIEKLAALLVMKKSTLLIYVDILAKMKLLKTYPDGSALVTLMRLPEQLAEEESHSFREFLEKEFENEEATETVVEVKAETHSNQEAENELAGNLMHFANTIDSFKNYLDDQLKSICNPSVSQEAFEKLEEELKKGNSVIEKLLEENESIKEDLKNKASELRKAKTDADAYRMANENLFNAMQERLQVMLADINNTITDFTKIPSYLIKTADIGRVQTQVVTAVTSTMEDLLKANTSKSE